MRLDQEVEWEKIATERERPALAPGEYRCLVKEVEDKLSESQIPFTIVKSEVIEGEHIGREIWDNIYLKTKKGETNKYGMGQLKEWAGATVGVERLQSKDFDTKEFEGNTVVIVTDLDSYQVDDPTPGAAPGAKKSKSKTVIKKVLRA